MPIASTRHRKAGYRKMVPFHSTTRRLQRGAGVRRTHKHRRGEGYADVSQVLKKKLHLQKHTKITTYGTEELDNVVLITKQTVTGGPRLFVNYTVKRDVKQAVYYGLHLKHHPLNKVEQVYIINGGYDNGTLYSIRLIPQSVAQPSDICKDGEQYNNLKTAVTEAFPSPHTLPATVFDSTQVPLKRWVLYKVKTISHRSDVMKMDDEHYVLLTFKTHEACGRFLKLKGQLIADDKTMLGKRRGIHDVELLADGTSDGLQISYAVEDDIVRSSNNSSNEVLSGANYYLPFVVFSTADTTKRMTDSEVLSVVERAKFRISQKHASTCRVAHIELPTQRYDAEKHTLTITKDILGIDVDWQEGEYACVYNRNAAETTDERAQLQKGMVLTSINGKSTLGQDSKSIQQALQTTERGAQNPMVLQWQHPKMITEQYYKGTGISMYRLDFQAMDRDVESKEALITFEPNYGPINVPRKFNGADGGQRTRRSRRVPLRARRSSGTMKRNRQRGGGVLKTVKNGINKLSFPIASLRKGIMNTVGDSLRKFVPNVSGRKRFSLYYDPTETNSYYVIIQRRGNGPNSSHHIAVVHEKFMVKADFEAMLSKMKRAQEQLSTEKSPSGSLDKILRASLAKFTTNKKQIHTSFHFLEVNLTKGYERSTHGIGNITPISLQADLIPHFEQALQTKRETLTHTKPLIVSMERLVSGLNTLQGEQVEFSLPGLKPEFGRIANFEHRLNESVIRSAIANQQIDKNTYKHIHMVFLSGHVYRNLLLMLCKEWQRVFSIGRGGARFVNGFWPSMLLFCATVLLCHDALLLAGVETISPAIEGLASVAGEDLTVEGVGLTKSMFMEHVAEFFAGDMVNAFSTVAEGAYGGLGSNPYYAGAAGAGAGALGLGLYGAATAYDHRKPMEREENDAQTANMMQEPSLPSEQLAQVVAQVEEQDYLRTETNTQNARESLDRAVQDMVENPDSESPFGDLTQLSATMESLGQLTSPDEQGNNKLGEMISAIQSLTKDGNFDPNSLSSLLPSKQSTEHLRNLCDVLLQLHDSATPDKKQLIHNFRESLIDKTERISSIRSTINEKQAQIDTLESEIQSKRDQIDEFTMDKNRPTNTQKVITSLDTIINELAQDNEREQAEIGTLRAEIARLQTDIDSLDSNGENAPADTPTESPPQPPMEEISGMTQANVQANQPPSNV